VVRQQFPEGFLLAKKQKKTCSTTSGLLLCWQTENPSAFFLYWAFVRAGQASPNFLFVNFYIYIFSQQRFRAGRYKFPAQQQALNRW
jgi:hypothetical protein